MRWLRKSLFCLAIAALSATPSIADAEAPAKSAGLDETELRKFNAFSKALYEKTDASVKARLENLDDKANHLFQQGTDIALAAMEATVRERLAPFKSPLFGAPPEADAIYADGKKQFEQDMKALSVRVANLMADEIAGVMREIDDAKARIAAAQAKLPKRVRARATAEVTAVIGKLAGLSHRAEQQDR